jgi:hypothetical protein
MQPLRYYLFIVFAFVAVGGLVAVGGGQPYHHPLMLFAFGGVMADACGDVITMSIKDFMRVSGLGLTTTYRLLNENEIESRTVGRRRLIVIDSYREYLERETQRGSIPAKSRLADPPRPCRRSA